ncbi:hypothetical protein BIY24_09120 [Halobacteriovorax marinus]|uniref:Exported protein n=1 Tax=Halobacteriovorax marinus (strain ATCC BAA-682 / DSM 15412 / SJ) TaxID=862908 RepID=E1X2J3_HALMS|nr:hypothetical protein [Halobacteriovorax marinus]ATH08103.1 hypothetical protein BIY24_09120 [Halobacteriovorax marinus]CBW26760.1 putative exported protein [Halobacteriovorax marinus SJ]
MKKCSLLLLLSLFIASCDAPRDRRTAYSSNSYDQSQGYYNLPNSNGTVTTGGSDSSSDDSSDDSDDASDSTIPTEIQHCSWSSDGVNGFAESSSHLGQYTLCQSTNKKDVWIQVKTPITDSQVCIIPTHNSGSASVYIGEPRCLMISDSKKIYKVTLYTNRTGYTNFSITGAMVMKDKAYFYPSPFYQYVLSPDAYIYCSQFLDQYKDSSYCNAFKSVGQYVYKVF